MKKNPKRFAGFATLPTAAPDKAAAELESRMKSGGFVGAVINGHNRGRYLDDKFFWPILECAEALNAPIHIHPTRPPQPVVDAYYSGFSPLLDDMFASPGWGWHIETAVHVIRLVLGGAFDRFPKLQLVIGHLGEGLMSMFQRLDNMTPAMTKLKKPVTSYLRENVHYTFSGFNFPATFLDLLAGSRRRPHHVLGRSSLSVDGAGQGVPGANPGVRRRPRAHRARQRGEASWACEITRWVSLRSTHPTKQNRKIPTCEPSRSKSISPRRNFSKAPAASAKNRPRRPAAASPRSSRSLPTSAPDRLAEMDAAGIDMQVLSLTSPGTEQSEAAEALALATEANDFLADVVKRHPQRFAGLAVLPTAAPDKAAAELELQVRQHKFVGAVIHGHNRGRYLDNKFFWPILECAEKLNAPIYLHPTPPPQGVIDVSYGGFAPAVTDMFAASGWGWHIETAVHIVRIVLGGVFDAVSETAIRHRPSRRGAALHAAAARQHDAGGDQAASTRSASICATTSTTPFPASISPPAFSICCSKSASTASCSRPTIPTPR